MKAGLEKTGLSRCSRPQEHWGWSIAIYLYLAGMGAGAYAVGLLADWIIRPDIPSKAILLWGPIMVAIGAPFLILDLGHKMRFLNACLNPQSSWVARGFLILSVLIITGLIVFAVSLLPSVLPSLEVTVPSWLSDPPPIFSVIEWIALIFAFGTAAYTGILLKAVRYIRMWDTWLLPLLFVLSALTAGSMGIILSVFGAGLISSSESLVQLAHTLTPVEQSLAGAESLVLAAFLFLRHRVHESGTRSVWMLLTGELKLFFWIGIVGLGIAFPVVLENVYARFSGYPALLFITGASLLTGGFLLRVVVLSAGIKEEHPLHRRAIIDYEWAAYIKDQHKIPADSPGRGGA